MTHATVRSTADLIPRAEHSQAEGTLRPFASARLLEIGQLAQRARARSQRSPHYIAIGQSESKCWVVKDDQKRLGGIFRSVETALRFARREASSLGCKLVIDSNPLELECLKD